MRVIHDKLCRAYVEYLVFFCWEGSKSWRILYTWHGGLTGCQSLMLAKFLSLSVQNGYLSFWVATVEVSYSAYLWLNSKLKTTLKKYLIYLD